MCDWPEFDESRHLIVQIHKDVAVAIDAADLPMIEQHSWHTSTHGYAVTKRFRDGSVRTQMMHRMILDAPKGIEVDHKNRIKLDNRRCNLRLATRSQNAANLGMRSDNLSGFRGVSWFGQTNRWRARIHKEGREHALGYFHDQIEAAKAYDSAAIRLFGEFAMLNFPELRNIG